MSQLSQKNLVGYDQIQGTGATFYPVNPATGEQLPLAYQAIDEADFEKAMSLAQKAFLAYRKTSRAKRSEFLTKIADNLEAKREAIVKQAGLETGLPDARLNGELSRTCNQLKLFANLLNSKDFLDIRIDKALPERTPAPRPDLRYYKVGLGPVAVFGASNFPLAFSVAGGDTASALAAGCPVVVKAHNSHLGTSDLVGQVIASTAKELGLPEGVFSLIYGEGNQIGQKLVAHPVIKAVGFTGSQAGGMALFKTANARQEPIPVYAEMSSINPVYVLPNALNDKGAEIGKALIGSMLMGAGQFCTSPGLVFVVDGEGFDDFIQASKQALSQATSQTMLNLGIAKQFDSQVEKLKSLNGVELLAAAQEKAHSNACQAQLFLVDAKEFADNKTLHEEVFGSLSVIIKCKDINELVSLTESLEGQLTASIHATEADHKHLGDLLEVIERKVGRIIYNDFGTGVEVCDAMVHGGPFPATIDGRSTSVGTAAIERFLRPVCYQNIPNALLPEDLQD